MACALSAGRGAAATGNVFIWLEPRVLDKLSALRGKGES
jgi:hypothetical protein